MCTVIWWLANPREVPLTAGQGRQGVHSGYDHHPHHRVRDDMGQQAGEKAHYIIHDESWSGMCNINKKIIRETVDIIENLVKNFFYLFLS